MAPMNPVIRATEDDVLQIGLPRSRVIISRGTRDS